MNPQLLAVMQAQAGVFSTQQAAAAGIDRDDLAAAVRHGMVVRVRRNVFTTAVLWNDGPVTQHRLEVAAALLNRGWLPEVTERLVAGHRSAACLWGFHLPWALVGEPDQEAYRQASLGGETPPGPSEVELVSADRCKRTYRAHVSVMPAQLPASHLTHHQGVPVTTLARTAVDLMRESNRKNGLIVADQALRLGCPQPDLIEVAEFCAGWRGGKQALELAQIADAGAESANESVARLILHDAGYRGYRTQHRIVDRAGRERRLDIALIELWVDIEPDGRVKYERPHGELSAVLWDEKIREDDIRDVGWEVVRPTHEELHHAEARFLAKVEAAAARARLRHAS
ncbi:hypothetical protein GCM10009547_46530 [Sporichthya brevicatena]|uniref:AbiEi antitoxin N-terminal domain-containing protein n=1 Tax=Sporichthya brevicatena TaxID=171442 RepID=A0ABN1HBQ3_9ACTN